MPKELTALAALLADLYHTEATARSLVRQVGFEESKIEFHADSHSTWMGIVHHAYTKGRLQDLCREVEKPEEFGSNPTLVAAVSRARSVRFRYWQQPARTHATSVLLGLGLLGLTVVFAWLWRIGPSPSGSAAVSTVGTAGVSSSAAQTAPQPTAPLPASASATGTGTTPVATEMVSKHPPPKETASSSALAPRCVTTSIQQLDPWLWQLQCTCDGKATKYSSPYTVRNAADAQRAEEDAKRRLNWTCP